MNRGVLVTGGSSGIGAATVRRFAACGDQVWFTYRTGGRAAEALAVELSEAGAKVAAFEFVQGDPDSHLRLVELLPGPVDVLVNNAAVGTKTVTDQADDDIDATFLRVNTLGPLWLIRDLLPGMRSRGYGKIVNIASVGGGIATFPGFHVADGMSKAALAYLTRHLAAELAREPVDVFAVCPGAVHTPMLRASLLDGLDLAAFGELTRRLPGGRLIRPDEIAELVWLLCEDSATVLRGAVLDASLGLGVHPGLITGTASVA